MQKATLRAFLNSAVIDPNDKKSLIKTIIEEGTPRMFELKAMELIEEASRIRARMDDSSRVGETLQDFYVEKMRLAATYLSLAVGKQTDGRFPAPIPENTGRSASRRTGKIPEST